MIKEATSMDAPSADAELILELASMFDGEFSLDWLVELTGKKASTTLAILEEQAQAGVLSRIKPAIYLFDESNRQIWQDRMPDDRKKHFHRHIASILIRELPDSDDKPLEISRHLLHATVDLNGCQWLMRAGEIYAESYQAERAIACFYHVLTELSDHYGVEEDQIFIRAAIAHANSFAGRTDLTIYLRFLKDARERAKKRDWQSFYIVLEMRIAIYERLDSDFNSSISRFNKAYQKAGIIDDPHLRSLVDVSQTYFLFWQGRFQEAINFFEQTVPDVPRVPFGFFPILASIMVGHCYTIIGQVSQGLGMLDDLRSYCINKNDCFLLAHASSTIANAMMAINRIDDAIFYLKASLKESDESHNEWVGSLASIMMALALYQKGNFRGTQTYLKRFARYKSRVIRRNLLLFPYLLEICWAMESGNLKPVEGYSLTDEIEQMLELNNYYMKGLAYRYKALQQAAQQLPAEKVTQSFNLSLKWLKQSGFYIESAKTQVAMTRYYLAAGNTERAESILADAADLLVANEFNLIPDDLRPLIKSENRQETILSEILDMARYVTVGKNNNRLLQHIITTANRITGAERGALLILDESDDQSELHLRAAKNISKDQISDPIFSPSMTLIRESVKTGQCRIFEAESPAEGQASNNTMIRSSICAPLVIGKKTIGVLYHDNRILGNVFKKFDKKLLGYLASIAALDIDRENKRYLLEQRDKETRTETYHDVEEINGDHMEGMVGESDVMKEIFVKIKDAAKTDIAVMITGETGVGKNMLAKAIHNHSQRKNGPFVTVQCSALTEGLITSELFGHEKGAFTGATHRHIGRFELANGGTLFLDEIGDLSLEVQARLLRVLQSKEFERVGGGKDVLTSDFRLIAATNKNLESEIRAKRFREDLFFRINVFPIRIPPLRDRRDDIPLLVSHMIKTFEPQNENVKIPKEAMKTLMQYNWPGNIRELENVVQRSLIDRNGASFKIPALNIDQAQSSNSVGIVSLEEAERQHIMAALSYTRGKVHGPGGAAELLDINPSTLASRIKKLGIKRDSFNKMM